jgi:hypothetical protein
MTSKSVSPQSRRPRTLLRTFLRTLQWTERHEESWTLPASNPFTFLPASSPPQLIHHPSYSTIAKARQGKARTIWSRGNNEDQTPAVGHHRDLVSPRQGRLQIKKCGHHEGWRFMYLESWWQARMGIPVLNLCLLAYRWCLPQPADVLMLMSGNKWESGDPQAGKKETV